MSVDGWPLVRRYMTRAAARRAPATRTAPAITAADIPDPGSTDVSQVAVISVSGSSANTSISQMTVDPSILPINGGDDKDDIYEGSDETVCR